jgi:hypothetical protein
VDGVGRFGSLDGLSARRLRAARVFAIAASAASPVAPVLAVAPVGIMLTRSAGTTIGAIAVATVSAAPATAPAATPAAPWPFLVRSRRALLEGGFLRRQLLADVAGRRLLVEWRVHLVVDLFVPASLHLGTRHRDRR